jgi:PBP1b-binding outer membrane lipoprotein LpoB
MKKIIAILWLLALLAGCVEFADEQPAPEESIYEPAPAVVQEPAAPEPKPVINETVPNPLAPLPEQNKSTAAVRPKSVPANSTTKPLQSGWTTESLSIEEGETKYVYIKQP